MGNNIKNALVGFFSIVGILIVTALSLMMKPSIGDGKKRLKVRFSEVESLIIGSKVCFSGMPIGRISEIEYIENCRINSLKKSKVFPFLLTLTIDSKIPIYETDIISAQNTGILGERVINIKPMSRSDVLKETEEPLWSSPSTSIENLLSAIGSIIMPKETSLYGGNSLIEKVDMILENFEIISRSILDANIAGKFIDASNEIQNIYKEESIKEKIVGLIFSSNRLVSNLDSILNEMKPVLSNDSAIEIRAVIQSLQSAIGSIQSILSYASAGNGTLGNVIIEDDIYNSIKDAINSANMLIDGIKEYGFFFHKNRDWQRKIKPTQEQKEEAKPKRASRMLSFWD